jgi:transposase-like protein
VIVLAAMKALTAEVVQSGERRDKRGRRIAAAEERAALIAAYEKSGLTQRAFAEREGVKFCTFTAWLTRHRRGNAKASFAEVSVGAGRAAGVIEIALPDGVVVRGGDIEQLVALIGRLRRC